MMKYFTLTIFCVLLSLSLKAQLIDFDDLQTSTVTDVDGNTYKTILFNDTWWMAENLKTFHYNDGTEIEYQATEDDEYDSDYWCLAPRWGYPNFDEENYEEYGLLYSWTAAADEDLCPDGWSLPDTADWFNLARYVVGDVQFEYNYNTRNTPSGGTETVYEAAYVYTMGQYLKSDNGKVLGTNKYGESTWVDGGYWVHTDSISNDCNASGMTILPAGNLISTSVNDFGQVAYFWTPNYVHSDGSGQGRRYMYFDYTSHRMSVSFFYNVYLTSVRCIKAADTSTDISDHTINEGIALTPNPSKSYINIKNGSGGYTIYSLQGTVVKTGSLTESKKVDISDLSSGIYIFKSEGYVGRFVKR